MEFKRNPVKFVESILLAGFAGVAVYFISQFFTKNMTVVYGLSGAVVLFMVLTAIFGENIKFVLEDKTLHYYERGKLKNSFYLPECNISYRLKADSMSTNDITMTIEDFSKPEQVKARLDCTPLGSKRFWQMLGEIQETADIPVKKLEVEKK